MRKFSHLAVVLVISIFIAPYALAQKSLAEQIRDQAVAGDNQSSNST